ncbi:MAG TPA: glycine cleavage T C-terminal barrel domain-containing protein, partial [Acidobacteriota bacterium]|nr:glycine cleavage T C-terminal barrel domain-containing protein [Acidobacteriota bacterium]
MTENNNPVEAGLDDAISLDKGCYVGQEVISKATYVGGVGRHLCQLLIETDTPIEKGAEVSTDDGQVIGLITSAAFSPSFDQTVALGYLKRDNAREEARHWVAVAGDRTAARVLRRAGRLMRES